MKNLFVRILLNITSSDAELDADSEFHVKIRKNVEYTRIGTRKSKNGPVFAVYGQ